LNNSYFCIIKTFRQQIIGIQFDIIVFLSKKFNQIGRLQYFFSIPHKFVPLHPTNASVMLLDELKNYKIYLASKSPRRRELLSGMGIDYELISTDVEESYDPSLPPAEVVQYLSKLKLSPIDMSSYPAKTIFIACDTIVVIDGKIIGKPADDNEAMNMLRQLSGHTHTVYSGLTLATPSQTLTDYRATEVTFADLSEEEMRYYVQQYRPMDKAGAYGVQEWIGYVGIKAIEGSFYNVMGLPTRLLWEMLTTITHGEVAWGRIHASKNARPCVSADQNQPCVSADNK